MPHTCFKQHIDDLGKFHYLVILEVIMCLNLYKCVYYSDLCMIIVQFKLFINESKKVFSRVF
jgi:hypothetical protein